MLKKIITIISLIVVIFILGIVGFSRTKKTESPFAGLIPNDASLLLILDPEISVHKVSQALVKTITASFPGAEPLEASTFLSENPSWRAFAYRPDAGWIVFEETRRSYPEGFAERKINKVWVYAKQGGIDLVESVHLGKEMPFVIKDSTLKISTSALTGFLGASDKANPSPNEMLVTFKIDGPSLKAAFQTSTEQFFQNADIPVFIPPNNTLILPLTSAIPKQDSSLFGTLISQIEIQPGGLLAFGGVNRIALGWPKNLEASDDFLKEQTKKLSHALAVRFPQTEKRVLPDGTIAELLVINEEQFKFSFSDDGSFAVIQAGDETAALADEKVWIFAGNNEMFVRDIKNAFNLDFPKESCKHKNGRGRAVFHLSSELVGIVEANGRSGVLCLGG